MKREVKIGLTVLVGIFSVYLFIAWAKSIHIFAASRTPYTAQFEQVAGLKEGDPVMVLGYPAGNVTQIRLDNARMVVDFSLDDHITLKSDARAEIQVKELMGGKKIEIFPGISPSALAPETRLNGTTSMDFSTAFSTFGDFIEQFDQKRMDSLFTNMNRLTASFADLGEELQKQDAGSIFTELRSSASHLNALLSKADNRDLVGKMDKAFGKLDEIAGKADEAMGAITSLSGKLESKTLPNADSLMSQVGGALTEVEGMMGDFKELLKALKNEDTFVGKLLYDPETAEQFDETLKNLDKTLTHIRTKKIFVTMTLSKKQKRFSEEVQESEQP